MDGARGTGEERNAGAHRAALATKNRRVPKYPAVGLSAAGATDGVDLSGGTGAPVPPRWIRT